MKHLSIILVLAFLSITNLIAQDSPAEIRLLIRGDDIASSHAANVACIQSYQQGIMRSVEIMVPCPWFTEAVRMLAENPGLDVGIHITLTSEWKNIKWGPVSHVPSLTDENGYFFPMIWPNDNYGPDQALKPQNWKIEEIEQEMRAQIEMAKRNIPHVSHLSCHMGCSGWDPEVQKVYQKLAKEYGLEITIDDYGVNRFPLPESGKTLEEKINNFISALQKLEPGNTYIFVEHPGLDTPEMQAIGHTGYEDVAKDRDMVTKIFTDEKIMKVIQERNIKLISYKDLVQE